MMTCLMSDHDIMIPENRSPMGLKLTRSLIATEFDDGS